MPRRATRGLRMDELTPRMRVEVENRYTSEKQNGLVLEVERDPKCLMVDGKPVASSKVIRVTISDDRGGEPVTITTSNENNYRIVRL